MPTSRMGMCWAPSGPSSTKLAICLYKFTDSSVHSELRKKGSHWLPFFFAFVMPTTLFSLILVILFQVSAGRG